MTLSPTGSSGSVGGPMRHEVEVIFLNGEKLRGTVHNFNPQRPTFFLHSNQPSDEMTSQEIGLESVKFVAFLSNLTVTKQKIAFPSTARLVTIRFLDREMIHGVTQSYGGVRIGLFLVPTDQEGIERLFVPVSAIRDVVSVKRLGEILTEQGMATPEMVERAIQKQEQLRNEQIGQILLKKELINDQQLAAGLSLQKQHGGKKIGEILLEQGFIEMVQLNEALEAQKHQRNKKLGEIMVEMGYATYKMIGVALSIQYNVPFIDLSGHVIDPRLRELVPAELAKRWRIVPLSLEEKILTIAVDDPAEQTAHDELRQRTGLTVTYVVSTPQDIARVVARYYEM
jgi:hypothetical protein